MSWHEQHPERRPSLDDELRAVLGEEPDFDYDALVAGATRRAGRLRRRRAIAQGAVAAVLVPSLLGTGWMVTQRLSVDDGPGDAQVATQTHEDGAVATETVVVTAAPGPDAAATTGAPASTASDAAPPSDAAGSTTPPVTGDGDAATDAPQAPPFQDPAALPELVLLDGNPDWPNRDEIPDPRPTGIPELDALGAPTGSLYPRTVPLLGFMAAADVVGLDPDAGVEPHSARDFSWVPVAPSADGITSVVLNVTAWDDAGYAWTQVTSGGTGLSTVWMDQSGGEEMGIGLPQGLPWAGHEGAADHLLVQQDGAYPQGGALVRLGDYLVGVTVTAADTATATDLASRVAEQAAANLAALDPVGATGRSVP